MKVYGSIGITICLLATFARAADSQPPASGWWKTTAAKAEVKAIRFGEGQLLIRFAGDAAHSGRATDQKIGFERRSPESAHITINQDAFDIVPAKKPEAAALEAWYEAHRPKPDACVVAKACCEAAMKVLGVAGCLEDEFSKPDDLWQCASYAKHLQAGIWSQSQKGPLPAACRAAR